MDQTAAAVTFGSGFLIAGFMQFFKAIIERFIKPGDPLHDPTIQLTAALVGAIAFCVHAATIAPLVATTFWEAAGQGATAGVVAIGAYHVATSATKDDLANTAVAGPSPVLIALAQEQNDLSAKQLDRMKAQNVALQAIADNTAPEPVTPSVHASSVPPDAAA